MGISRLDSLRLGSSKEDKFWGGGGGERTHYFQGNGVALVVDNRV